MPLLLCLSILLHTIGQQNEEIPSTKLLESLGKCLHWRKGWFIHHDGGSVFMEGVSVFMIFVHASISHHLAPRQHREMQVASQIA